jgi:hypothetical protein
MGAKPTILRIPRRLRTSTVGVRVVTKGRDQENYARSPAEPSQRIEQPFGASLLLAVSWYRGKDLNRGGPIRSRSNRT